ncbi:MAG: endonuclease domain-containing protein, partial [Brevibacterium sp.]|nr:endonuclease domain-containing protein [Brevibacterium sp.]
FNIMYKIMTTQQIIRLGFTHNDIRRARSCCVRRLSRGVYSVRHVCTVEGHRRLWASIAEGTHAEFTMHGDIRDEIAELDAAVMARCEVRFQKQGQLDRATESDAVTGAAASDKSSPASPPAEVFSHISAALIHGLPIAYPVTHQVEVVRPGVNRRFKSIHVRGVTIPKHHRQGVRGTEVTTLERTLIDVARTYNPDISVSMLDNALHRGLTTREKILATLAQCLEKRNTKKVHLVLDLADARRESPAESIAAVRFFQHGFVGFVPQTEFDATSLRSKIRVDFCHKAARLIVEIDGLGKLYLGSGVPRDELERERRREQWLRDQGWRVIRVSWKELFTEAKFEEVRRVLMGTS